jgi:hypothetical protein
MKHLLSAALYDGVDDGVDGVHSIHAITHDLDARNLSSRDEMRDFRRFLFPELHGGCHG